MAFLWDKPEDDETFQKAEWLRENSDAEECLGADYRALCSVYHDVFNNGGGNLHVQFHQDNIERIGKCAAAFGIDCPVIFERDEEDPSFAEIIDVGPLDELARDLIENIHEELSSA